MIKRSNHFRASRLGRPSGGSFLPRCCSSARARSSAAWGTKCAFNSSQNLRSLCPIARLACFLSFGSGSIPKKRKLVPAVPRAPGSTLNSSCASVPQCSHLYLPRVHSQFYVVVFWSRRRPEGSSKHSFSRDRKRIHSAIGPDVMQFVSSAATRIEDTN